MTLVNKNKVTAHGYKIAIQRLGLEQEFMAVWDASVDDDRCETDLDSISEDLLIKKTLEEADDAYTFSMSVKNGIPEYHVVKVTEATAINDG